MLALLFLCLITMITLMLYISFFFSPSLTASNYKLRSSFIQSSLSGWETCTACKITRPTTARDVKLEIQDAKDLVNFHITHFENQLKVHFSAIVDGIDQSYTNKFQKSSEAVIEKLENIKATVDEKYKELSESLGGSGTDISEINSRMKLARTEVPKFVKNGLDSFVNVFKNLKNEFTVNKPDVTNEKNSNSTNENGTNSKEAMNSDNKSDSKDERIDLGSIPPEAIIRTIDMYLEDLKIEGDKLLNSLLNDKTKSRRFQQSLNFF